MTSGHPVPVRRAEILAALAMATDLAMGQPLEFALQSCVLANRLARKFKLDPQDVASVYYQSLLRYIGCNAETHTMAALFGDEIAFRRDYARIDPGRSSEIGALVFAHLRHANRDAGLLSFIGNIVRGMITSSKVAGETISAHCEVAQALAGRLGLDDSVCANLGQLYERWDGKGLPVGLKGEAIAVAVRIVTVAQDAIVLTAALGAQEARAKLLARRGSAYEPRVVDALLEDFETMTANLAVATLETVLALEAGAQAVLSPDAFDAACLAMADFADLKTPHGAGHSRAVAGLVREAARRCGLSGDDVAIAYRAGLVHDLGQVAIPARVWLKPGPFDASDRELARLHTYYGERVLSRTSGLAHLGAIVGQHHERLDGSGYHRGARGPGLSAVAKLLAAAEAYQNKIEPRPHRAAMTKDAAALALRRDARDGRLDGDAVKAVLAAAGHAVSARIEMLHGLTAREFDILRSIAQGLSMKEIARQLGISPKTVENHAQNIYGKIGVKTRGGATLFAIEHGICGS